MESKFLKHQVKQGVVALNFKKLDKKYKVMLGAAMVGIAGIIGLNIYSGQHNTQNTQYSRESTRDTTKLASTEFLQNLRHGNSLVDKYFGHQWLPMPMPINEKYEGLLKEKVVFVRTDESLEKYSELLVMDTYTSEAFPNISTYLKKHAKELNQKNPDGKIKILHDGDKGIIYQWAVIKDGKTEYLEFGKVEQTDEGVLSVKYINKGTDNLEHQRQCAIKFFTKI